MSSVKKRTRKIFLSDDESGAEAARPAAIDLTNDDQPTKQGKRCGAAVRDSLLTVGSISSGLPTLTTPADKIKPLDSPSWPTGITTAEKDSDSDIPKRSRRKSRQEQQREDAEQEVRRKRSGGLDAALSSDSDLSEGSGKPVSHNVGGKRAGGVGKQVKCFKDVVQGGSEGEGEMGDSMDDFIAEEDEEEDQDDEGDVEQQDDEQGDEDDEVEAVRPSAAKKAKVSNHRTHTKANSKASSKNSKSKKKTKRILFTSDDDADDESDSDSAADGPMLYWQVNALREEAEENARDDCNFFQLLKSYTIDESFALYIEMLAQALVSGQDSSRFVGACKAIENLICTHRESLLGSSAWGQDFLKDLQSRPFYMVNTLVSCSDTRCAACGRSSQKPDHIVRMFGPSYDANCLWSSKWIDAIPEMLFLADNQSPIEVVLPVDGAPQSNRMNKQFQAMMKNKNKSSQPAEEEFVEESEDERFIADSDEDEQEECSQDEDQEVVELSDCSDTEPSGERWWLKKLPQQLNFGEPEVRYNMASHCKNRTQMYHTLLHYKFRLLLKVRAYLERLGGQGDTVDGWTRKIQTVAKDSNFVQQELRRFQALLKTAGRQYGGQRYEDLVSTVWSDDECVRRSSSSAAGGAGRGDKTKPAAGGGGGGKEKEFVYKRQSSMLQFVKKK